ncbi:NAD(P)-dependent alcohol dehydrogenase [Kitasatospora sp. NPDC089797]|uniref:NAD(P)-dependent alcohol dehydrogenase n=1 Tax=Kitasatospora sp. NPDC089797 TaxID=3155298 RepID=UPI003432531F
MMRAIVHSVYGGPEVLRPAEVERPRPGPGEVLVEVHASAVDPGVWHVTAGLPYLVRATPFRLRRGVARVRGTDVAGRVVGVGADVSRLAVGDEVFGSCDGAFAEYARVRADRLARMPAGLDFREAAVLPVSACTALQALRDRGRLRPGQSVLVIGASGGIGVFAVQLAKALGAGHVTAVCGPDREELVRSLGADEAVDHTRADPTADPTAGDRRYDLVLDLAGNRPLAALRRVLAPRGTLVLVGGEGGGRWFGGLGRQLGALARSPFSRRRFAALVATQPAADLRLLAELVERGALRPVVDSCYPLAEVPAAVRRLRAGRVRGKLAVSVR